MSIFDNPNWSELVRERARHRKTPEQIAKTKNTQLTSRMWRTYSMALGDIQQLHRMQEGRCANVGCRMPIRPFGKSRAVDHCHKTGAVRGMLCKNCNMALGLIYDDPKRLLGLVEYLTGNKWAPAEFLAKLTAQQTASLERGRKRKSKNSA